MSIHALNYTPKAIAGLRDLIGGFNEMDQVGVRLVIEKLRAAQVFQLPDHGELLDRSTPRLPVPEVMFKPPFASVAAEYPSPPGGREQGQYTVTISTRRIALAWEWCAEEYPFGHLVSPDLGPGVVISSVCYLDDQSAWMVMPIAFHLPYEDGWEDRPTSLLPYEQDAVDRGQVARKVLGAAKLKGTPLPITPFCIFQMGGVYGQDAIFDAMVSDVRDEVNAYSDMCIVLACQNVSTDVRPASRTLNKERLRKGKEPHRDVHILKLHDHGISAHGGSASDRSAPRGHVRRGHIRRLNGDRLTWVNQAMVRGRGFVEKVYAL